MNKTLRKELKQWGILIAIGLVLYLTGLHVRVIGFLQRGILATGLIRPKTEINYNTTGTYPKFDLNLDLQDADGQALNLQAFQGKVLFINLWATWCPPCLAEMPNIAHLFRELENSGIQFVMISQDRDFNKAIEFVRKKGYDFPVYQARGSWPAVLNTSSIPTTFVIDKQGNVVVNHQGMAQYNTKKFITFLQSLN